MNLCFDGVTNPMQPKIKYGEGVNWQDPNTSHVRMVNLVGPNKSVLEFGCSTGYMSRVLKANGCKVVGVEIDPDAAKQAAEVCDRVIVSDAERGNWAEQLKNDRFEVIVFGDVLEHLADPLSVLRSVRPLISEDGYVVASIPN